MTEEDTTGTNNPSVVDFEAEFRHRVVSIGHILCMMSPWNDPSYLHRLWCIFEIFTAMQNDECSVTIVMPPREERNLYLTLFKAFPEKNICWFDKEELGETFEVDSVTMLYRALANTRVENAGASFASDREMILSLIQDHSSFSDTNYAINEYFRQFYCDKVDKLKAKEEENGDVTGPPTCFTPTCLKWLFRALVLYYFVGAVLAYELLPRSVRIIVGPVQLTVIFWSIVFVMVCSGIQVARIERRLYITYNLGLFFRRNGDYEKAMECFRESLRYDRMMRAGVCGCFCSRTMRRFHRGAQAAGCDALHASLGEIMHEKGDYDGALVQYGKALYWAAALGDTDPLYATLCNKKGKVLLDKGALDEAMEIFQSVERLHEKSNRQEGPAVVETLCGMAEVFFARGNYPQALEVVQKAEDLVVLNGPLPDHLPDTAAVFELQGKIYDQGFGDVENSLLYYSAALDRRRLALGENHPFTARSLEIVGLALKAKGDYTGAKLHLEKSLDILHVRLGREHPDTVRVRGCLDQLGPSTTEG
jgi:tetratricopeptide (TPR) repeat protein